jgi:Spy/CpxP family protein refolding chaperone
MKRFACLIAFAFLAACSKDTTAPATNESLDDLSVDLIQQYDATGASAMDRAGIGASDFPDTLKLTAEQKARIQALHEAYQAANQADLAALRAIKVEAEAAIKAGKSREQVRAILARADPIMARLATAMAKLQRDIWAIYTPGQQAWITGKGRNDVCSRDVLKSLTAEQSKKIADLKAAFTESVKGHLETIKKVGAEARAAAQAGASREQVAAILRKADAAMEAVKQAERRLAASIMELLTPEQKKNTCLVRLLIGG